MGFEFRVRFTEPLRVQGLKWTFPLFVHCSLFGDVAFRKPLRGVARVLLWGLITMVGSFFSFYFLF
jgi:hypothetical protein